MIDYIPAWDDKYYDIILVGIKIDVIFLENSWYKESHLNNVDYREILEITQMSQSFSSGVRLTLLCKGRFEKLSWLGLVK